jgi:pimeloyl-ACP methyl ester carboxylesterase
MVDTPHEEEWLPGAEQHFLELPHLRMHVVTMGPEDGVPVILLHGFPEFWYSWRLQIPALAEAGFRVIAPDQRGYNLTDKRGPYDIETLTDDIAHLQDLFDIPSSHIVGHDWGGIVAWAFAAAYPERTEKLGILNAPHPQAYLDAVKRPGKQLFMSYYMYVFQLPRLPEYLIARNDFARIRKLFEEVPRRHMHKLDVERYVQALKRPGALTAAINWYRALPSAMIRGVGRQRGNDPIAVPTCVIWGEQDVALSKACNRTLDRYVVDLTVHYLSEASHWVQIDHPGKVNRLLTEFLAATEESADL